MKIRNGFVSNSSSSSFLVVYHTKDDFAKFSQFEGYDDLINGIGGDSDEDVLSHISTVISSYLSCTTDRCSDYVTGTDMASEFSSGEYFNLVYGLEIPDEMTSPIDKYDKAMWDYADEVKAAAVIPDKKADHQGFWKCVDGIRKQISDKSEEVLSGTDGLKDMPNRILGFIKSKGYAVSCVEYGDDTDDGAYMEHEFMPFVAMAPRSGFYIHTLNLH